MRSILVIHTTQDESVHDRIRAMELNPDLRDLRIYHTFLFTPADADALRLVSPHEFLEHHEFALTRRFHLNIACANPDLVVLDTGVGFCIAPYTVLSIIETLKKTNPRRTFAIQKGQMYFNVLAAEGATLSRKVHQLFNETPELQDLVERLF